MPFKARLAYVTGLANVVAWCRTRSADLNADLARWAWDADVARFADLVSRRLILAGRDGSGEVEQGSEDEGSEREEHLVCLFE